MSKFFVDRETDKCGKNFICNLLIQGHKKQEGHDGPKLAHLRLLVKSIQFSHKSHNLKKYGRGPLDDATCHISKLYPYYLGHEDF